MPFLRRVKMHKLTATSPAEMSDRLRGKHISAMVGLVRSKDHPGNLDFAVTARQRRDLDLAKDYLENIGWLVGDEEVAE